LRSCLQDFYFMIIIDVGRMPIGSYLFIFTYKKKIMIIIEKHE